jgi:hypothetical protein
LTPISAIWLLALLLTKHFIADYPLQPRWMYANKGIFGHPGGIAHAALHAALSAIILAFWVGGIWGAFLLGAVDFIAHYWVDFAKVHINKHYGLTPTNSEQFWWLLGLDQWLHHATYIGFAFLVALTYS